MKKIYLLSFLMTVFFGAWQVSAQYCVPNITSTHEDDYITHVIFEEIDNVTGADAPYNDFTDQVATVNAGETYELTISSFSDCCYGNVHIWLFIDWNQDGNWDDSYHIAGSGGSINGDVPSNNVNTFS